MKGTDGKLHAMWLPVFSKKENRYEQIYKGYGFVHFA